MPSMDHGGSIVNTTVVHHHAHMTREDPQMKLRLPLELKDQLAGAAAENGRSMNAEIVSRLAASFSQAPEGNEQIARYLFDETKHLSAKLDILTKMIEGMLGPFAGEDGNKPERQSTGRVLILEDDAKPTQRAKPHK